MIDAQLRDVKEKLLTPLASITGEHLHPITISLIGGVIGVGCIVSAALGFYLLGLMLWMLNRLIDGLDGVVARYHDQKTDLGAYADIMLDFMVYAFVPIALVVSNPSDGAIAALVFLLATFYINSASWMYLSALLEKRRYDTKQNSEYTSITMPAGWIEGAETVAFYIAFFLLPGQLVALFTIMGLMVLVTIGQRVYWAIQNL